MSIAKRLINGSLASWFQIGIVIVTQIFLVPVYLSAWDIKTYGLWLALQAFSTLFLTVDIGHQTYLNYEFLRIGKDNLKELGLVLWSGVWMAVVLAGVEVILLVILSRIDFLHILLDHTGSMDPKLITQGGYVLVLQGITWLLFLSGGGVMTRVLSAFGYYPRVAWWTAFATAVAAIAPAVAVVYGADLLQAAVVMAVATSIFYGLQYIDVFYLLRKNKVPFNKASFKLGWRNFVLSSSLSLKSIFENARNVGARIILAPLTNATGLVAFTTIRTGANFAMQGLHSVTWPMLPDLMAFLKKRDQERTEAAMGTIWIIIVAVLVPAVVVLQTFIGPLFRLWTRGKVAFDPSLFLILSLSVLVYAIAQPAIAIVTGNNLLKVQLRLSAIAALLVVLLMLVLVPRMGLSGAGIALLVAEIYSAVGYIMAAKKWLRTTGIIWPVEASRIAIRSVYIGAIGMAAIIAVDGARFLILALVLLVLLLNLIDYCRKMPDFAWLRIKEMFKGIPLFRRTMSAKPQA